MISNSTQESKKYLWITRINKEDLGPVRVQALRTMMNILREGLDVTNEHGVKLSPNEEPTSLQTLKAAMEAFRAIFRTVINEKTRKITVELNIIRDQPEEESLILEKPLVLDTTTDAIKQAKEERARRGADTSQYEENLKSYAGVQDFRNEQSLENWILIYRRAF